MYSFTHSSILLYTEVAIQLHVTASISGKETDCIHSVILRPVWKLWAIQKPFPLPEIKPRFLIRPHTITTEPSSLPGGQCNKQ